MLDYFRKKLKYFLQSRPFKRINFQVNEKPQKRGCGVEWL